jgi:hypothetical protein
MRMAPFLKQGRNIFLTLLFSILLLTCGSAGAAITGIPFQEGEKLTYRAKWGLMPAGRVTLEVLSSEAGKGEDVYHFAMHSRTSAGVDTLYSIRDMQHSCTDLARGRSLQYEKRSSGTRQRNIRVDFDWENMKATYKEPAVAEKTVAILPGTLDPLALIYALRLIELKTGDTIEIPVTTGKGFSLVRGNVIAREKILIDGKAYDTFVIVPEKKSMTGLLEKQPQMKIWLSAGKSRIPLKLQIRHTFGSIHFELISAVG